MGSDRYPDIADDLTHRPLRDTFKIDEDEVEVATKLTTKVPRVWSY